MGILGKAGGRAGTGAAALGCAALIAAIIAVALAAAPSAAAKGTNTIKGTNKSERISGTKKGDRINARGGNDRVKAKAGNDRVKGGSGKDKVKAGSGKDKTSAGAGKDKVSGGSGKDKLKGGAAKDKLSGGGGNDTASGGGGGDKLTGGKGKDKLIGGEGGDGIDAVDGSADAKVAGGPGRDSCRIDAADAPRTSGCENLEVVGGDPGPDPDPDPDPSNEPLTITSSDFSCPLPSVLGLPSPCTFTLAGTGADLSTGTVAGTGGVANASGSPQARASGNWTAAGNATCTAAGGLKVTIGTESDEVPVGCPSGVGVALSVTSTNFTCLPAVAPLPAACTVVMSGEGADTVSGTVTGDDVGVATLVPIPAASAVGGSWTAVGAATCTANGTLTVTFGEEMIAVPVECGSGGGSGGGGGGGAAGPLAILAGDPVTCPRLIPVAPGTCAVSLVGTGADATTGTVEATEGISGLLPAVVTSPAGGGWTAAWTATCTADGTLKVTFGAETVEATVDCG